MVFVVACAAVSLWEGGLAGGLLPWGPDLMPLFGLAIVALWYVSPALYACALLTSATLIDSMQGMESLPTLQVCLVLVSGLLIVRLRMGLPPTLRSLRLRVLAALGVALIVQSLLAYPYTLQTFVVQVVLSAAVYGIWYWCLHSRLLAWFDSHIRSTIHVRP